MQKAAGGFSGNRIIRFAVAAILPILLISLGFCSSFRFQSREFQRRSWIQHSGLRLGLILELRMELAELESGRSLSSPLFISRRGQPECGRTSPEATAYITTISRSAIRRPLRRSFAAFSAAFRRLSELTQLSRQIAPIDRASTPGSASIFRCIRIVKHHFSWTITPMSNTFP